jgi:hypothetical protein
MESLEAKQEAKEACAVDTKRVAWARYVKSCHSGDHPRRMQVEEFKEEKYYENIRYLYEGFKQVGPAK